MKKLLPCLAGLAVCVAFAACGRHKPTSAELQTNRVLAEILKRQDARSLGGDRFFPDMLDGASDPEVLEACALALGRIGDPRALPWLFQAFRSPYFAVRATSAFAVGEIEDRELLRQEGRRTDARTVAELTALLDDSSTAVRMRATEALGKAGAHAEAVEIARRLESFQYDGMPPALSYVDLAITALIRLRDSAALPALEKMASVEAPEIQWRAANALVRLRDNGASRIFQRLIRSSDPDVRAYAARGLGITEDGGATGDLVPLLPPRNPRTGVPNPLPVRVCAVQSLGNLKAAGAVPAIAEALLAEPADPQHPDQLNFALQAASALGNIGAPGCEPPLARLVRLGGPAADAAVVALARLLAGDPDRFFSAAPEEQFTTPSAKRARARALGILGGTRAAGELWRRLAAAAEGTAIGAQQILARLAQLPLEKQLDAISSGSVEKAVDRSDTLAMPAVIASLAKTDSPGLQQLLNDFLVSHDPVVLRAAVAAYEPQAGAREPWAPVMQAYRTAEQIGDVEGAIACLNRLEPWSAESEVRELLRKAVAGRLRNVRIAGIRMLRAAGEPDVPADFGVAEGTANDSVYSVLAAARNDHTVAILQTTRGDIEFELFWKDAPLTAANFVSLARRGFYDGLSFMRVVPFFVIQGGDPRDDQEGGPGYTIRCEINQRPFEKGSIGMALSGKDTGGSQFFLTLAPQPHLDGGYTCFGRVIGGMSVAEKIVPGDRIVKVRIVEEISVLDYRN